MSSQISLAYGRRACDFSFDDSRFSIITKNSAGQTPLSDFEVGSAFDSPIASPPIDEIAGSDDSVLIVVSDATRATASAQIVNLLVRRLIQAGVSPANIAIIFATGIHRPVGEAGVRAGALHGNAVHEECERVATLVSPAFGINTIVDENKRAVKMFCGDWRLAHRAGCEFYLDQHSVAISAKRDIVIASCGGFPHDINLIQAHKALDMAALACNDGGTIILVAECSDGLGRPDFLKWFEASDSRALEARLVNGYEVNGQTAWALLTKAERYRVCLVSELPSEDVKRMRMVPMQTVAEALEQAGSGEGFIMPRGAAVLPRITTT